MSKILVTRSSMPSIDEYVEEIKDICSLQTVVGGEVVYETK